MEKDKLTQSEPVSSASKDSVDWHFDAEFKTKAPSTERELPNSPPNAFSKAAEPAQLELSTKGLYGQSRHYRSH